MESFTTTRSVKYARLEHTTHISAAGGVNFLERVRTGRGASDEAAALLLLAVGLGSTGGGRSAEMDLGANDGSTGRGGSMCELEEPLDEASRNGRAGGLEAEGGRSTEPAAEGRREGRGR